MSERPWSFEEELRRVRAGLPPWRPPIDWSARFQAAATVAGQAGAELAYGNLERMSYWIESAPPDIVEAIGRALLGGDR